MPVTTSLSIRGIPRPFQNVPYDDFVRAFDETVGACPEPSETVLRLVGKARKYCRVLAKFPGVRRVWVCNSLSMNAAEEDSDIDLFIETEPGRLWTGRAVATAFFSILGVRRHGSKVAGRFCLSFFAVENADLGKVAIENDAYLYEWARRLVPVDGREECPELPNGDADGQERRSTLPGPIGRTVERAIRAALMPKTLREYERLGKPWGIAINDTMLKFHPEDRRKEIRKAVAERLGTPETA